MSHKIVCTAGHIDHGKTALTRALTGMDTDRLPEEKARGITIDLGFAYYRDDVTIIDVPGHERFIRNMAAGAATVDFALLVVAADDGPMLQTQEHLDILQLLGIRDGMIVLTKTGLVEPDWADLVMEEVKEMCQGTFLEGKPAVKVDASSGEGIEHFRILFDQALSEIKPRLARPEFRLPVDRCFNIKGFGTVVTGSIISGAVKIKDNAEHLPSGKLLKVRGIQIQGKAVEIADTGCRAALNLSGAETSEISRGDVLAQPGLVKPAVRYDCRIELLKSAQPLKHRTRLRFHLGTAEIIGRILLLEDNLLQPGAAALAQMELENTAMALRGDRFIFRTYSPQKTIGGGLILMAAEEKHKRKREPLLELLSKTASGEPGEIVLALVMSAGSGGISQNDLLIQGSFTVEELESALKDLTAEEKLIPGGASGNCWYIAPEALAANQTAIAAAMQDYHRQYSARPGMTLAELKSAVHLKTDSPFLEMALQRLIEQNRIVHQGAYYTLSGFQITLSSRQAELADKVMEMISGKGLSSPKARPIAEALKVPLEEILDLLAILETIGKLVRLEKGTVLPADTFAHARHKLYHAFGNNYFSLPQAVEALGAGRRITVDLLEYMDRAGYTERIGEERKLII